MCLAACLETSKALLGVPGGSSGDSVGGSLHLDFARSSHPVEGVGGLLSTGNKSTSLMAQSADPGQNQL